jgi:hypothetical protein
MRIKPTLRHLPHDVLQGKIAMISKFTDDPGRELTVVYAKDNTSIHSDVRVLYIEPQAFMPEALSLWGNSSND